MRVASEELTRTLSIAALFSAQIKWGTEQRGPMSPICDPGWCITFADALPPALTSGPVLVTAFVAVSIGAFAAMVLLILLFARRNRPDKQRY